MSKLESIFTPTVRGHVHNLKYLLEQGINPNQQNESKQTPLLLAINQGHFAVVKMLLENGADPNLANIYGQTPLFVAVNEGRIDIVSELLKYGANPQQQTRYGNTPLFIAAVSGQYKIAKLLLHHEEKHYSTINPLYKILKRLTTHLFSLIQQSSSLASVSDLEENRHEKIEFLILLLGIIKQIRLDTDEVLTPVLDLEKRYQHKVFSNENPTRKLFEATLRCIYSGKTISFEEMLSL